VDIRLTETPGYCIEGAVETAAKDVVITISEQFWFTAGWNLTPAAVRANAEGAFRACGLHPGEYRLMASSGAPGTSLADRMSGWAGNAIGSGNAQVLDKDVRGIRLTERAAVPIEGDAVYDPPPQGKAGKVSISVSPHRIAADYADSLEKSAAGRVSGGFYTGGGTAVPGPFKLGRLRDGEWELKVSQLAAGCYVKSAVYGQQDLLRSLLHVGEGGGAGRVQVAIGCDGATVTARVTDAAGNPAAAAIVYLIDAEVRAPAEMVVSMRRAQATNGWSAPLTAVRPGKYLAVATTLDLGSGSADDMEELWSLRGDAKPVEAGAGAMAQVSLTVIAR
jgi:hypothetical protein